MVAAGKKVVNFDKDTPAVSWQELVVNHCIKLLTLKSHFKHHQLVSNTELGACHKKNNVRGRKWPILNKYKYLGISVRYIYIHALFADKKGKYFR